MTESARKAIVKKALRNTRKAYRAMDTAGEKLERRLDRLIDRKTYPTGREWEPMIAELNAYKNLLPQLERAAADAISASAY